MTHFDLPDMTAGGYDLKSLEVRGGFFLTAEEFEVLRSVMADARNLHASARNTIPATDKSYELVAMVGLHDFRDEPDFRDEIEADPDTSGLFLHYNLGLRPAKSAREDSVPERWDDILGATRRFAPAHGARVYLRLAVPKERVALAVSLPVLLSPSDVSGFSHITGVRLAQVSPDNIQETLYSVILDLTESGVAVVANAQVETDLGTDLVTKALERTLAISRLAAPLMEAQ